MKRRSIQSSYVVVVVVLNLFSHYTVQVPLGAADAMTVTEFPLVDPSIASLLGCNHPAPTPPNKQWILELDNDDDRTIRVSRRPCQVRSRENDPTLTPTTASDLIPLAHACDQLLFSSNNFDHSNGDTSRLRIYPQIASLVEWVLTFERKEGRTEGTPPSIVTTLATIFAVHALEQALGHAVTATTRKPHLGATPPQLPLLKNLVQQLSSHGESGTREVLKDYLQALLLPTNDGLNLRNLLWHGFIPDHLPRPWLALVLVAWQQVESMTIENEKIHDLRIATTTPRALLEPEHTELWAPLIEHGRALRQDPRAHEQIRQWLAPCQRGLWDACRGDIGSGNENGATHPKTLSSTAVGVVMILLLEHGLREAWCRLNHMQNDAVARSHVYYVTLDGHGQLHQHNILLHPYLFYACDNTGCCNGHTLKHRRHNQLYHDETAITMALLTDIFLSPVGPNLRSRLAHGPWELWQEDAETSDSGQDVVELMWTVLWLAAGGRMDAGNIEFSSFIQNYRPHYSYTASTSRSVRVLREAFTRLIHLQEDPSVNPMSKTVMNIPQSVLDLELDQELLRERFYRVEDRLGVLITDNEERPWTAYEAYAEYDNNVLVAPLGATRLLLQDVTAALDHYSTSWHEVIQLEKQDGSVSSRSTKRRQRIVACHAFVSSFMSFAAGVALLALEQTFREDADGSRPLSRKETLQAVQRTRMVVSTVDRFVTVNADRAFKAADDYTKSKLVTRIRAMQEVDSSCELCC